MICGQVKPWPQIDDRRTLDRFSMSDAEFAALAERLADRIGGATYTAAHLERALSYPWHESPTSVGFHLVDDAITELDANGIPTTDRWHERHGLIAIGSNADAATLRSKLAGMPDPNDRELIGLHGELVDFMVGHSPHLAVYGALPATLLHRPRVSARVTLLMVTSAQLTALSRTEFNYLLARVPAERFVGPVKPPGQQALLAYVSRHGVVTDGQGEPLALQRPHQRALLDRVAQSTLGESAKADDVVRRTVESYSWAVREARPRLSAFARPLDRTEWDLHPGH